MFDSLGVLPRGHERSSRDLDKLFVSCESIHDACSQTNGLGTRDVEVRDAVPERNRAQYLTTTYVHSSNGGRFAGYRST